MNYCDSSFLIPLYLYEQGTSEKARKEAAGWTQPGWVSPLGELEFTNSLCRKVFEEEISPPLARKTLADFKRDFEAGLFVWRSVNLSVMFRDAGKLSLQRTPSGGHRSLDILHVSAAKMLGASRFLSFDERLNRLVKLEGMRLMK